MSNTFSIDHVNVISLKAYFDDNTKTKVNETTHLLKYESQHFQCKAHLELKESYSNERWSLGFVQACDGMYLENRYGQSGSSFWEFHPLKSGRNKIVNDSDGQQYPFYCASTSKYEIKRGFVKNSIITLYYNDHFYPTVAWELPYCNGARLTDVIRKQHFIVWLVAIKRSSNNEIRGLFDVKNDRLFVLKTIRWRYNLHMKFDVSKSLGHRLVCLKDKQKEDPHVLDKNIRIPVSALNPPHCNAAQSLIWYPRNINEKPRVFVEPQQIIVSWETWANEMTPSRKMDCFPTKEYQLVPEWPRDLKIGTVCDKGTKSFRDDRSDDSPPLLKRKLAHRKAG